MSRWSCFALVALVVVAVDPGRGFAQPMGPRPPATSPGFSPYLNLARRDVNPAINYYGIVRPQIATANALRALQQAPAQPPIGGQQQTATDTNLPITGQPTYFLNNGGYFLNAQAGPVNYNPSATTRPKPFNPSGVGTARPR